mgnify:FL=1
MREDIRYYIGTDTECQALIDFLQSMDIPYSVHGVNDWVTAVKFMSPFRSKTEYDRLMDY